MYYKVDDKELEKLKEVSNITSTDYDLLGNFVPVESMFNMIEDLLCELHRNDEKIKDMEQDIENNYEVKNINPYEEYGISEKDFI